MIKLKHLNALTGGLQKSVLQAELEDDSTNKIDVKQILQEILGTKRLRWYHALKFLKTYKSLSREIERLSQLDPKLVEENPNCKIKKPEQIDSISLGAMIELQIMFQNPGERTLQELYLNTLSLSLFESHCQKPFDSNSQEYKEFQQLLLNTDIETIFGLFNWVTSAYDKSIEFWNKQFNQVQVSNADWDQAGGKMMEKFSILNNIKSVCQEFNLSYQQALQIEYGLSQASQLSKATLSFIEDNMRVNMESRMRFERQQYS